MQKSKIASGIVVICSTIIATSALASSHREAPNITRFPTLDSTDFYVFNSYENGRDDFVTLIANYIPLQDAYGGPNYFPLDPAASYNIHIDTNGDAIEDITYAFTFKRMLPNGNGVELMVGDDNDKRSISVPLVNVGGVSAGNDANVNFKETYRVTMISGDFANGTRMPVTLDDGTTGELGKPLDYIGNKTFTNEAGYAAYADSFIYNVALPNCGTNGRVFVGQRKDPFVVNLGETFDLVNYVPVEGDSVPGAGDAAGFPGGITQDTANDDLRNKNVTSIAIEIPKICITGTGNGVIGAWTTASLPQARILNPNPRFNRTEVNGGSFVQVSRLGSPLVNELVIGIKDKDQFSSASPSNDGQFANYVTHPSLPELLNILFKDAVNTTLGINLETLAPTNFPRTDLVAAFLTGVAGVNQLQTVTPSEMLRLNTGIAATPANEQSSMGVVGDDLAGFPNGRRPGDDVVDIALRVVMGALCHPIPVAGEPTNLGFCAPEDASVGNVPFTDGAPSNATMMMAQFPYLALPIAGSE